MRHIPHPHLPTRGAVLLDSFDPGVAGEGPPGDIPVPPGGAEVDCHAVDPVTGAICNKLPDIDGTPHIIHKCVDDGIEFSWKELSSRPFDDLDPT